MYQDVVRNDHILECYDILTKVYLDKQTDTTNFSSCSGFNNINFDTISDVLYETYETSKFIRNIVDDLLQTSFGLAEINILDLDIVDENLLPLINSIANNSDKENNISNQNDAIQLTITTTNLQDIYLTDTTNTKAGQIRKRRKFVKSKTERRTHFLELQKHKHPLKTGCNSTCNKKCSEKFSDDVRKTINHQFWLLNYKERKMYVINHVEVTPVQRRRGDNPDKKNKSLSYKLKNKGKLEAVCKKFFLTTLGFSETNDSILKCIYKKNCDNITLENKDNRGIAKKRSKIDRLLIQKHITSFSPCVSHYRRKHAPNKLYLPSDVSIKYMHEHFKASHPQIVCSYEVYRKIVTDDMNISFTKLGNEECEKCEALKLHNPNHTKENMALNIDCENCINWSRHIEKYVDARTEYKKDCEKKIDSTSLYVSVDMQKVIMLPRLDMFKQVLFTPRIIVFNESFIPIGNIKSNLPFAALWHEGVSGRKQADVISTFHAFLSFARDYENVVIWADNCTSQNKNWSLLSFLIYIINSNEVCAQNITIKYFQPGHTFMSADSFHHEVELGLKKKPKVYDFQDFVNVVRQCNASKVLVKEMTHSDFSEWPNLTSAYQLQKLSAENQRPLLKDICEITAKRGFKYLFYRTKYGGPENELHFLMKKYVNSTIQAPKRLGKNRGITKERKETILKNLSSLMPGHKLEFWKNLTENDSAVDLTKEIEDF